MRVLYVSNNYPPHIIGGAELMAHRHAVAIQAQGLQCLVFAGDHTLTRPCYSIARDEYEGIPVIRAAFAPDSTCHKTANFRSHKWNVKFEEIIRDFQPDLVHFHNLPGLSVDFIELARRAGCSTVLTVHDPWGFCHRQTLITPEGMLCNDYSACSKCLAHYVDIDGTSQPIEHRNEYVRTALKQVDVLISPSTFLARQYVMANAAPAQVAILKYGVDLAMFSPLRPGNVVPRRLRFGVACHLSEHKGIRTILEAVRYIGKALPFDVVIAGKGPMEQEIKDFISKEEFGEIVKFVGAVQPGEMSAFYQSIDVFIVASIWPENQPLTILEAMACGAAVIATDCGGSPELVLDGKTGTVVPRGDAVKLGEAILNYAKSPATAIAHGQEGCREISRHSLARTAHRLSKLYSRLIAGETLF